MLDVCVIGATSHEVGHVRTLTTSLWLYVFRCYILQNQGDQRGKQQRKNLLKMDGDYAILMKM